jgi:hypothetical protein
MKFYSASDLEPYLKLVSPAFQFMLLLVATRTLYILGFRKMDSKNSVLHGCTDCGGVDI